MRVLAAAICLAVVGTACQAPSQGLPATPPSPPGFAQLFDPGFVIEPRPACTAEVTAAVRSRDLEGIKRLAARGAAFTCELDERLPLDYAVIHDDPARVLALLQAHGDPNARWFSHGDRFPLQEALEARSYNYPTSHRDEIIRILLAHGADPNERWCPFESRGLDRSIGGCVSIYGVTPLMWAAAADEPATTFLLLQAGADPTLENQFHANALDLARSEAVFFQLAPSFLSKTTRRGADLLDDLGGGRARSLYDGPWDEMPLTRAIVGGVPGVVLSFPPLPDLYQPHSAVGPSRIPPPHRTGRAGRVKVLLALGADANSRLDAEGIDWTPLALAIRLQDDETVRALLGYGADPNARWCVTVDLTKGGQLYRPEPDCTRESGITPLMFAASIGRLSVLGALLERYDVALGLTDWRGRTALDYAERAGHADAVYELRRAARMRGMRAR